MLTARPAISRAVRPETADSITISSLARLVSGMASVRLNETAFVYETAI
jgi:hypothetical protein